MRKDCKSTYIIYSNPVERRRDSGVQENDTIFLVLMARDSPTHVPGHPELP